MDSNNVTRILTINSGSSSIKLALFEITDAPKRLLEGAVEDIGQPSARFVIKGIALSEDSSRAVVANNHVAATEILVDWLKQQNISGTISAIGHRIVHGGPKYYEPCIIDDEVVKGLRELTSFDPLHLPVEIQLIETFRKLFPSVKQVACFDTAFHHDLPNLAQLFPIPRHYAAKGVRRYGFHGLSYAYVMQELRRLYGPDKANGRLILAHLGNGVSLAAVHNGRPVDTTMSLTPAAGVPMSTRSGDLDPGLASFLAHSEGMNVDQFNNMVNFKSGLLGMSETTSDMEELLKREAEDSRAKEAVDVFCYQIKKTIGSLSAALGGLDTLVFTGGMGENAPKIRARICEGLEFLGIELEESRNATGAGLISSENARVAVHVIHTDESFIIAQDVQQLTGKTTHAT